jgi:hypothetical protein
MEHGYSGLDERSKVRYLLTGIQDNAVQPMVCQVLAMREEEKTFTMCLALFADFIRHLKQNPSNMGHVAKLGSGGRGGRRGRDARGRGGGGRGPAGAAAEAQAKTDPQTKLRLTKSLGFRPTSTTPQRNTESSLQPRNSGFTSTARSSQLPSAKLLLCCAAVTMPPGESDDDGDLFGDHNDGSVLSKHSTC